MDFRCDRIAEPAIQLEPEDAELRIAPPPIRIVHPHELVVAGIPAKLPGLTGGGGRKQEHGQTAGGSLSEP